MAYVVRIEEMIDAIERLDEATAEVYRRKVEAIADEIADELATRLGVIARLARCEPAAFAGCAVVFEPAFRGQRLPDTLEGFDNSDEWGGP